MTGLGPELLHWRPKNTFAYWAPDNGSREQQRLGIAENRLFQCYLNLTTSPVSATPAMMLPAPHSNSVALSKLFFL